MTHDDPATAPDAPDAPHALPETGFEISDDLGMLGDGQPPEPADLAAAVFDAMMSASPVPGTGFGSVADSKGESFICAAWTIGPAATAELKRFMAELAERHPTDGGFVDGIGPPDLTDKSLDAFESAVRQVEADLDEHAPAAGGTLEPKPNISDP